MINRLRSLFDRLLGRETPEPADPEPLDVALRRLFPEGDAPGD